MDFEIPAELKAYLTTLDEFIEAEIAVLEAALAEDGEADWSRRFVRMAVPD